VRLATWSAVLAGSLLVAACSGSTAPRRDLNSGAPALELGFTQILPEEGTNRGLLRVINRETRAITVTAVGLSWPGYGEVLQPTDGEKVVPAESELMLRIELPPPRCTPVGGAPPDPVRGMLTVDGQEMTHELTDPAQTYVERLWRTQCDGQLLDRSLRIRYADDPRVVSMPDGYRVDSALLLTRLVTDREVRVLSTGGSVLYDLQVPDRLTIPSSFDTARVPLVILPGNRCDEHAIGQATAPFDFSLTLRLGNRRVIHVIRPPVAIRAAASSMLRRHCAGGPA
jgi:hypothetical protein